MDKPIECQENITFDPLPEEKIGMSRKELEDLDMVRYILPGQGAEIAGQLIEEIRRLDGIITACHKAYESGDNRIVRKLAKEQFEND